MNDTDPSTTLAEELEAVEVEIKALEARKAELYRRSMAAPDDVKVCSDAMADIIVDGIERDLSRPERSWHVRRISWERDAIPVKKGWRCEPGSLVSVRPCGDEHKGKTYLGIMIGDVATSVSAKFNEEAGVMQVALGLHNPCMWVPELGTVVYGAGSWWGVIETTEDLRKITDADIESVWYVQAMRSLVGK